jgi:hypothetical protein
MPIDPDDLTPSEGVALRTAGSAAPPLLKPASHNCRGGSVPSFSYSATTLHAGIATAFRRAQIKLAAAGGTIFVIGDSQMQLMDAREFSPFAMNFAVGGDTALAYLDWISKFDGLVNCAGVVLQVTQNDLTGGASLATTKGYWDQILAWLTGPLVLIEAYPLTATTWKANLAALNTYIGEQVAARANCEVVSINAEIVDGSGNLRANLTWEGDGQHVVDPASLRLLAGRVRAALRRVTSV